MTAFVVAALLVWCLVCIWVARHHEFFLAATARVRETRVAVTGRSWAVRRLGGPATRLAQWLSVDVTAVLGLLSGLILVALLAAGFTKLLDGVLEGELDSYVDRPVSWWVADHRDGWLTGMMKVLTHVADPLSLVVITVIVSAWVCWRIRSWLPAVLGLSGLIGVGVVAGVDRSARSRSRSSAGLAAVLRAVRAAVVGVTGLDGRRLWAAAASSGVVLVVAKWMVGRSRPPSWTAVIVEDGFSFPSGHATGGVAVAVLLAWMAGWVIRGWTARVVLWAGAATAAGTMGFSRVYLGVHYLSDVVAGAFLGAAWAIGVIVVGAWWESRRRSAQPAPASG
ncbi:phosphatase PAP2 family protein [Mycobacterium sp. ELW1]|uniref:phosphatase PAP2 family protein n=1 Tax=Mycobacterium sp. ELW1 TaxID=1547487 RepID=UPI0011EE9793|nr:phosphatase PAP2 family protein [Mycobacterium sp. ELW1]QEN15891.1 phosphatase PAP2 family protein [Mycobacterium sp. ELW1]